MPQKNSMMPPLRKTAGFNHKTIERVEKMARETFDEVLKRRDDYTQVEVDVVKQEILERIADGEDGFDIIDEYGLEPDYLEDLICW